MNALIPIGFAVIAAASGGVAQDTTAPSPSMIAVRSTGLSLEHSKVVVLHQYWWPEVQVFQIHHGTSSRVVAVDESGEPFLLTGGLILDKAQMVPGRLYRRDELETSTQAAIEAFNTLTALQAVDIVDDEEAEEYLEFFLAVHIRNGGAYLPGTAIADMAATAESESREYEILYDGLRQVQNPVVQIRGFENGYYEGQAFEWLWWCDHINEYTLTTSRNGQVTFRESVYGEDHTSP